MQFAKLVAQRIHSLKLAAPMQQTPAELVTHLGAVQSQMYGSAKWALAMRLAGIGEAALDTAFNAGQILRTHILRPTWHFVAPADIRWMLELTAPRVHAFNAYYYRQLAIDAPMVHQAKDVLIQELQGGKSLTRKELAEAMQLAGIETNNLRVTHLMMIAELDGLICSGPLRGKQFTYMLLDERVPAVAPMPREQALAELTRRYFTSHGPATVHDFSWWSGLTIADIKIGIAMQQPQLASYSINDQTYWYAANMPENLAAVPEALLLPIYDEYAVGYKDHGPTLHPEYPPSNDLLGAGALALRGGVIGGWKATSKRNSTVIEVATARPLSAAEQTTVDQEAERYAQFKHHPVEVIFAA